jgi:hypothetical protein
MEKCEIYGKKSKMSARRHFWGRGYPPVFAYVGERKELWEEFLYVGETLGLRRKWKIENGPPSRKSIASAD